MRQSAASPELRSALSSWASKAEHRGDVAVKFEQPVLLHRAAAKGITAFFSGMDEQHLPYGEASAIEWLRLTTHTGTHLDARDHLASAGKSVQLPSKTAASARQDGSASASTVDRNDVDL